MLLSLNSSYRSRFHIRLSVAREPLALEVWLKSKIGRWNSNNITALESLRCRDNSKVVIRFRKEKQCCAGAGAGDVASNFFQ